MHGNLRTHPPISPPSWPHPSPLCIRDRTALPRSSRRLHFPRTGSSSKSELARSTFSMISNTSRSAPWMARLNPKAQSLHSDWLPLKSFNFIHLGFSRCFDPAGTLSPNLPMSIKNCSSVKVKPAMTTAEKG